MLQRYRLLSVTSNGLFFVCRGTTVCLQSQDSQRIIKQLERAHYQFSNGAPSADGSLPLSLSRAATSSEDSLQPKAPAYSGEATSLHRFAVCLIL